MYQTDSQLATAAAEIKDETTEGANSATRVGTLAENLNDSKVNKRDLFTNVTADYTLLSTDAAKVVVVNSASANNLTIAHYSTQAIEPGMSGVLVAIGNGVTTIVAGSGVTLRSADDLLDMKKNAPVAWLCLDQNDFLISGTV